LFVACVNYKGSDAPFEERSGQIDKWIPICFGQIGHGVMCHEMLVWVN